MYSLLSPPPTPFPFPSPPTHILTTTPPRPHRPPLRQKRNLPHLRHLRPLPANHPGRRSPRLLGPRSPLPSLHARLVRGETGGYQHVAAGYEGEDGVYYGVFWGAGTYGEDD